MSASTDKLPPVPSQNAIADPGRTGYFGSTWSQWFTQLKAKVDIINASLVQMAQIIGVGLAIKTSVGWLTRTIQGTTGEIEVINGDGVSGNPTIQLADTTVTPGNYTNTNLTVDQFGRITAAANGSGSGGVDSVVAGTGISVDNTDPANPIVSATGSGGSGSGGTVLQTVYQEMATTFSTSDTTIPLDNTIPQITEGVEISDLSVTITPQSADSIISVVLWLPWVAGSSSSIGIRIAAFYGSGPDAVFATSLATNLNNPIALAFKIPSGGTTAKTITFRCGVSSGTFYINRTSSTTAAFGGVLKALVSVQELLLTSSGGGSGYPEGTSFPASPTTDEKFYRTDLNILCYWNGIYWLSVQEYQLGEGGSDTISFTSTDGAVFSRFPLRTDFQLFVTKWIVVVNASSTAPSTSYWTINLLYALDGDATLSNTLSSFNTQGYTTTVWKKAPQTINTALNANAITAMVKCTKVGSPGILYVESSLCFRLIVT